MDVLRAAGIKVPPLWPEVLSGGAFEQRLPANKEHPMTAPDTGRSA